MIRMLFRLVALCTVLSGPVRAAEVTVFAAASLGDAMSAIAASFEAATGHNVVVSLAGSSTLARQIERGAPADVFVSANVAWVRYLVERGALDPDSRADIASNRLVLIGPAGAGELALDRPGALADALGEGRLAMALVDAVPVGIYGKDALAYLGLWAGVAPRVAQADNARAALAMVATGAVPLGVVYATDARADPRVSVRAVFPAEAHMKILYPAMRVAASDNPAAAEFLAFLTGSEARATLAAKGFVLDGV